MEQQIILVSKASIPTLQARCAVIAAAKVIRCNID